MSGVDVGDPEAVAEVLAEVDDRIGLDRLRALHVNDAAAPLGSNRDRHANVLEGELGERIGAFLAHPAVQSLPAVMETPGPDGHGPDAAEMQKLRDLHGRWTSVMDPLSRGNRRCRKKRPRSSTTWSCCRC